MEYDSREDTQKHIDRVRDLLYLMIEGLAERAHAHDRSKLESPEKEVFDRLTPALAGITYGSDEYRATMKRVGVKDAMAHHYAANSHHPEHYENGIRGMNLLDVVEMFCDWKAASERHADGDFAKSIEYNQGRFDFSDDLLLIFQNTIPLFQK